VVVVRVWVYSGLAILCALTAQAQQQERKLIDRIMKPDRTLASPMANKSFVRGASAFQGKQYSGKGSYEAKKFPSRSFRTRTPWYASRRPHSSDRQYDAAAANLATRRVIPNLEDPPSQPVFATSQNYAARKKAAFDSRWAGIRPSTIRGTKQDTFDRENEDKAGLTIDQVRAILNRSK
jgi:hypothetical protein